ncbi:hypothetical protein FPV16_07295 [Methylobacterium sp. W2]|uniref:hypothetical protein n=1 Tax=Methylobacterium sp. W2 TaxID=2598107 RepID=UPI001D0C4EC0|nr:hypothetical protein [Methylobacterium sp. W2]MCC0806029.1 hypothetical protein [Methylobacterium sp. W2]
MSFQISPNRFNYSFTLQSSWNDDQTDDFDLAAEIYPTLLPILATRWRPFRNRQGHGPRASPMHLAPGYGYASPLM